jgi:hypothetical protein
MRRNLRFTLLCALPWLIRSSYTYGDYTYHKTTNAVKSNYTSSGSSYEEGQFSNHYKYGSNKYSSSSGSSGSSGSSSATSSAAGSSYSATLKREVCDNSVVRVTAMKVACDSPYTFYYGNGANRNSPVCDYGDKATFTFTVTLSDTIQEVNDYYMTMAVFDPSGLLLASVEPELLCRNYIGYGCAYAGSYTFIMKLKLSYYDGQNYKFSPIVRMAFSTQPDSGYNLGAVNTQCKQWDANNQDYVQWKGMVPQRSPTQRFLSKYGIMLGSLAALSIMAYFIYRQSAEIQVEDPELSAKRIRMLD